MGRRVRQKLIELKIDLLLERVESLHRKVDVMSVELDRIKASVAALTTVTQSTVTLLGDLSQRIRDLQNDPVELAALADEIDARKTELADAVTANTPTPP